MPTAKTPAVQRGLCKALVKNDKLQKVACGLKTRDGVCPNASHHVMKHKTGQCAQGWCEGTKPVTWKGTPAPTCKMWQVCGCTCHEMYDMMFAASDKPRELVDYSEYKPPRGQFWIPSPEERMEMLALSRPGVTDTPTLVESPLPDTLPATLRRTFTPTATGRAARGELESWVKEQCDVWLVETTLGQMPPCTPVYLAEEIGKAQGIKPPSVGAISAVFERWMKMDFARVEKKPTRFIAYTEQGIRLGLEGCKDKARRAKRSAVKAQETSLRRR